MFVRGIRRLFNFPGYVVDKITVGGRLGQVILRRDRRVRLACPACGATMAVNREATQAARDLPLGSAVMVMLTYPAIQGRCSRCGKTATIHPPGIEPYARATTRLMNFVCRLARVMTLSDTADLLDLSSSTAYRWDFGVLNKGLPPPKLDGLRILLIDEKMVRKRHGYVTLVMNGENGELLYMAEGKKKESLDGFFAQLSPEQSKGIVAVAMDRAGAYYEVVKARLKADIVFDKFHLVKNYNDVLDEVRRAEWRKAKAEDKQVIKGQRYNLFRRPEHRSAEQTRTLEQLLAINKNLNTAHVLGEALGELWTYQRRGWAAKYLAQWVGWARESGVAAVRRFAKSLRKAKVEVLNYCKHQITTARLEGFNNLISRIIHRACGVTNLDYLFLKLRQESLHWAPQK